MQLPIAVKPSVLCCHLANTNEEWDGLATAIPPLAQLRWLLLLFGWQTENSSAYISDKTKNQNLQQFWQLNFALPNQQFLAALARL